MTDKLTEPGLTQIGTDPTGQKTPIDRPFLLVIRHEPCTSLGLLEAAAQRNCRSIRYWEIAAGESLPAQEIDRFSHLVILGGRMGAYEDAQYPFLHAEFRFVEAAIERGIPTLGICLGSQVLARVLGGKAYPGNAGRETGWCEVELTEAAKDDRLLGEFPSRFNVFQFHQDTFELPPGTVHLAKSATYPHQAFRYQNHVWALQFHLEFDERLLNQCANLLNGELQRSSGLSLKQLFAQAQQYDRSVGLLADRLMQRFLSLPVE
ncbi:type 1 glutamine amidotransferase [Leptolyngbya ohadii]|uniref:type 1 glutamine amidotransferase n=1 Tax=Leptolyngbya ohadii TaxID=1962290 RepID=UPI000B59B53B|nr:type 1 glutamine amidotransferase [Leptolyngbya ohadii]